MCTVDCRLVWKSLKPWAKTFCIVALTNYLCVLALSLEPLIEDWVQEQTNPLKLTNALLLLIILIFQVLHTYFGILDGNIFELYANMAAQLLISAFCVLYFFYPEVNNPITTKAPVSSSTTNSYKYSVVLLVYASVYQIIYLIYAIPLKREFLWRIFRKAGADTIQQNNYKKFLLFGVLLKLDLMLSLVDIVLFVYLYLYLKKAPWYDSFLFSISFAVASVFHYCAGRFGISNENTSLTILFWCLSTIALSFIAYSIYNLYKDMTKNPYFILGTGLLLVFHIATLFQSVVVFHHFGQGLKKFETVVPSVTNGTVPHAHDDEETPKNSAWEESQEEERYSDELKPGYTDVSQNTFARKH